MSPPAGNGRPPPGPRGPGDSRVAGSRSPGAPTSYGPIPETRRGASDREAPRDRGKVTFLPQASSPHHGLGLADRSHERLRTDRLSGVVELVLQAVDDLHVGSGSGEIFDDRNGPLLARSMMLNTRGGTVLVPVVPGSSLKGVVRTLVETVAGGCGDIRGCGRCVSCGMFGHAGRESSFAGRVGFDDAEPVGDAETGLRWLPMPRRPLQQSGRRVYSQPELAVRGEVPYEVIPSGTELRGRMSVTNLREDELGLVLRAMGADGSLQIRLGGGKFGGLGRCQIRVTGARLRRGYRRPGIEVLDEAATVVLVKRAVEAYYLDARANAVLGQIRGAHQGDH